jgi:hypothetical protein
MSYEVEYVIPFEILFAGSFRDTWEVKDAIFTSEILSLLKLLDIKVNPNTLAEEYCHLKHGQGNVHVFFDPTKQKFIVLDLYFGHTEQHNMIVFGIHVPWYMIEQMKEAMLAIYDDDDAIPKSDFKEYFNNKLLVEIDKSNYPKKCEFNYQKIIYHYSY